MLGKEKSEIFLRLENKKKEAVELHDIVNTLTKENKRLTKTDGDLQVKQKKLLDEIETLQSQVVQSTSDCSSTKQSLNKCLKEIEEVKLQKMDAENMKHSSDAEFSSVQRQCQTGIDNLRSQYQFEIDSMRKQYQSDLDHMRRQYQSDLDKVRNEYQSNIESLTMHITAKNKYMQSQNTADQKCDEKGNQCVDTEDDEENHRDRKESHTTTSSSRQHRRSNFFFQYFSFIFT